MRQITLLHQAAFALLLVIVGFLIADGLRFRGSHRRIREENIQMRDKIQEQMRVFDDVLLKPTPLVPSPEADAVLAETLWLTNQMQLDRLFHAVCWGGERTYGKAYALNAAEDAAGIAQITPICIEDTNRILELQGSQQRYTLGDRWFPHKSREVFEIYCGFYADTYSLGISRLGMSRDEAWARIWNKGPKGWKKDSSLEYWRRVEKELER